MPCGDRAPTKTGNAKALCVPCLRVSGERGVRAQIVVLPTVHSIFCLLCFAFWSADSRHSVNTRLTSLAKKNSAIKNKTRDALLKVLTREAMRDEDEIASASWDTDFARQKQTASQYRPDFASLLPSRSRRRIFSAAHHRARRAKTPISTKSRSARREK